ncbi:hypothetical protein D917_01213 [Trichinella nativa]|uniref:ShKT domain-containing protein n=1 Tax=Trichinella nativa TaxID=6335 RepID=A0A1Y3ETD4_9BILA|nr:hypothetical protein D917_01213 [Trichinella nativa]
MPSEGKASDAHTSGDYISAILDYNELCLYWAYTGLCNRAPYMNTMCAYSCRACC